MPKLLVIFIIFFLFSSPSLADTTDIDTLPYPLGRCHISFSFVNYISFHPLNFPESNDGDINCLDQKGLDLLLKYSLIKHVDLTGQFWGWAGIGGNDYTGEITPSAAGLGFGMQYNFNKFMDLFYPSIKTTVYYYSFGVTVPKYEKEYFERTFGGSIGFVGEYKLSKYFSIPFTINYHHIKNKSDYSGIDFNLGISCNFGY